MWGGTGPSSIFQSNHLSSQQQQQQRFETVTSGKKKKKQKMVRADPSLLGESGAFKKKQKNGTSLCFSAHANWTFVVMNFLSGFSVNASSERLNMGEIETLEDF